MANVERLKQVKMAIENFEENFSYRTTYCYKPNTHLTKPTGYHTIMKNYKPGHPYYVEPYSDLLTHDCLSCGCVIGYVSSVSKKPVNRDDWDYAVRWLELEDIEAEWLFQPSEYDLENSYYQDWYLKDFDYDETFEGWSHCTHSDGVAEALRRLQFMIDHYSSPTPEK